MHLQGHSGCKPCYRAQMIETKIANGTIIPNNSKPIMEIYYQDVRRITNDNYNKYSNIIDPQNRIRSNSWHVDHIFSIQQGFMEYISPEIIGHWSNLQILSSSENQKKGTDSWKSRRQLLEDFKSQKR